MLDLLDNAVHQKKQDSLVLEVNLEGEEVRTVYSSISIAIILRSVASNPAEVATLADSPLSERMTGG